MVAHIRIRETKKEEKSEMNIKYFWLLYNRIFEKWPLLCVDI